MLSTLGALVQALGVSEAKRVHYLLCHATRDEATRPKVAALRGLAKMYSVLANDGLLYVAEAVPFVSELMEDAETVSSRSTRSLCRSAAFRGF